MSNHSKHMVYLLMIIDHKNVPIMKYYLKTMKNSRIITI